MAEWRMNCMVDLPWQSTNNRSPKAVMFRNITWLLEMAVCCAKPPYLLGWTSRYRHRDTMRWIITAIGCCRRKEAHRSRPLRLARLGTTYARTPVCAPYRVAISLLLPAYALSVKLLQRLPSVFRQGNLHACLSQGKADHTADVRVIVGEEYMFAHELPSPVKNLLGSI
jgi:hypothetical protein